MASLRAQHAGDLAGLDAALSQLAKAHADEEGVKALRTAIERMRQRRGAKDDTATL